ncbi:MAG: HIT family protein [bacterium]
MHEKDCLFCKIIRGEIPTHFKIYEDEETLAFLDIQPVNPGHVLVITKDHFENLYTTPDETLCRVIMTVKKMAVAVKNGLGVDGINLAMNNETESGQKVPHTHIHIIPRTNNDGLTHWKQRDYVPGEAEEIAKKIKEELKN